MYAVPTSQWALAILFVVLIDAWPLHPLPPHEGIVKRTYIGHYGPAWYDPRVLREHRGRVRRAADGEREQALVLSLHALDRKFTMHLIRDTRIFAKDAVFEGTDGPIPFDTLHSYVGTIEEDENAVVEGIVTADGLFDGSVSTQLEEYYFEPTSRYLSRSLANRVEEDEEIDTSPAYHTIAYRASDVVNPKSSKRCASQSLHLGNMSLSNLREDQQEVRGNDYGDSFEPYFEQLQDHRIRNYGGYYSREGKKSSYTALTIDRNRITRHLHKRATVDPRKTTCMLYLQADHQFFSRYATEEACIEVMTRHVQRVNSIYKHTDFNQDGRPDNISFMIKRVKVHNAEALKDPNYRFPGNYGVEKFLELFSEEDYDAFCLAYMFTYRDFEMGTLGLAWTGDLKNAGGVCEKNGHYRGSMKSLNTGIVTLLNYGKHVPPAVSHVTLAHEIGHNFGSPHDPEQCTPGGEDGNFIMFARATSGDKRNNNRFSPCSLNAINPVLNTKARSPKGCFTEPQASLCGNGVVEDGEECDCGWEEDCRDTCCFPQRRYPPAEGKPCTLTPRATCSPSQGPCCTNECKLRFGDKCREDNGCRDASFCDGRTPHCPPSINKPNKTICNEEFVCFMGECTGSICLAFGLESCQCIPGPNDPATKACELCCRLPGENQPCLSSFDWNSPPYDIPDKFAKPGTPCNDYNGYCDVFQKCREVDPSGPLATLRKLLLSDESLATFRRWVAEHWYAVALLILGTISLLMASIRYLGKRPDQKLKSVTIIHSSTTETVRLPPEGTEGVTVHPPVVRAKLPLSRKVREKRHHVKQHAGRNDKTVKSVHPNGNKKVSKKNMLQKKKKKKKKRVAPIFIEEAGRKVLVEQSPLHSGPAIGSPEATVPVTETADEGGPKIVTKQVKNMKKRKSKEVIDYSQAQADKVDKVDNVVVADNADPKSKVRSWLLASSSHCRVEPLTKSKSTPAGLTNGLTSGNRLPAIAKPRRRVEQANRTTAAFARDTKNDRVRLQIVYKPPFKFSVRLRKAEKIGQSSNQRVHSRNPPRTAVLVRTSNKKEKFRIGSKQGSCGGNNGVPMESSNAANSDIHTVPSDLEVLLSESEFLFSE
ncbi:disintegrin and metalloproteinase domain-containing protein 10-like isoform X1 [Diachasmimorpha longicaudata]|uniref:disintegrin and metalloproteinase domain-containing protein 10-like isoform X1 n=1 Tax=Diachasmimorpha longicaudata TaxID=58733 RepID=UPI0030B8CFE7